MPTVQTLADLLQTVPDPAEGEDLAVYATRMDGVGRDSLIQSNAYRIKLGMTLLADPSMPSKGKGRRQWQADQAKRLNLGDRRIRDILQAAESVRGWADRLPTEVLDRKLEAIPKAVQAVAEGRDPDASKPRKPKADPATAWGMFVARVLDRLDRLEPALRSAALHDLMEEVQARLAQPTTKAEKPTKTSNKVEKPSKATKKPSRKAEAPPEPVQPKPPEPVQPTPEQRLVTAYDALNDAWIAIRAGRPAPQGWYTIPAPFGLYKAILGEDGDQVAEDVQMFATYYGQGQVGPAGALAEAALRRAFPHIDRIRGEAPQPPKKPTKKGKSGSATALPDLDAIKAHVRSAVAEQTK